MPFETLSTTSIKHPWRVLTVKKGRGSINLCIYSTPPCCICVLYCCRCLLLLLHLFVSIMCQNLCATQMNFTRVYILWVLMFLFKWNWRLLLLYCPLLDPSSFHPSIGGEGKERGISLEMPIHSLHTSVLFMRRPSSTDYCIQLCKMHKFAFQQEHISKEAIDAVCHILMTPEISPTASKRHSSEKETAPIWTRMLP